MLALIFAVFSFAGDGMFLIDFESNIKNIVTRDTNALIPPTKKYIQVQAELEPQKEDSLIIEGPGIEINEGQNILLEKVGIWAPGSSAKEKDQLPRLKRLSIKFVADDEYESKKDLLEEIVAGSLPRFPNIRPQVEVSFKDLDTAKAEIEPTAMDWIREFKTPLALVLTGLLFCLFLIFGFFSYRSVEKGKLEIMGQQLAQSQPTASEESSTETESTVAATGGVAVIESQDDEDSNVAIERYREMLQSHPGQSLVLFRQWLNSENIETLAIVNLLSSQISGSDFEPVLEKLSTDERKKWLECVRSDFDKSEFSRAKRLLSGQIIESFLAVHFIEEEEKQNFLASLSTSEMLQLAEKEQDYAAVLFNIMGSKQVAMLTQGMDDERIEAIIDASLTVEGKKYNDIVSSMEEFVTSLRKERKQLAPMVEKAPLLIESVDPKRELPFFKVIAKAGEFDQLRQTALRNFPAELIFKLPSHFHKEALKKIPVRQRAELIVSLSDDQRSVLDPALGEGRGREIIEVEIDEIKSDEERVAQIMEQKDQALANFTSTIRSQVLSSDKSKKEALILIEQWMSDISDGAYSVAA